MGAHSLTESLYHLNHHTALSFNTSLIRKQKFWMRLTWIHQSFEELGDSKVTNIYSGISDSIVIRKQIILFSGSYCQIRVGAKYFMHIFSTPLNRFLGNSDLVFLSLSFFYSLHLPSRCILFPIAMSIRPQEKWI